MMTIQIPPIERFLSKIRIDKNGCWNWLAGKNNKGYGRFWVDDKEVYTHRFIYEYYHGDIDPNLTIDHLCRNPACGNPIHLEQITKKENNLRGFSPIAFNAKKTHCSNGHPLSGDNVCINRRGDRVCKKCLASRQHGYYFKDLEASRKKSRERNARYTKRHRLDPQYRARRNRLQRKYRAQKKELFKKK